MTRLRAVMAAVACVGVLAGCGLPVTDSPTRIDPSSVPYQLLEPLSTGAPSIPVGPVATIYFIGNDHLVPVRRHVARQNTVAGALRTLLLGPTAAELARGYRSAIPSDTSLISLDVDPVRNLATVDLTREFGTLRGSDQVLAVAQIVFTVTQSSRIKAVEFAVGDRIVAVPNGEGSLDAGPRTRADYGPQSPG